MNLLLDQNISYRVVAYLEPVFGSVKQVKQLGLTDVSDVEIWNFSKRNNYTIITFDSDFIDIASLHGSPPKIIWLRFGNASNLKIVNKLVTNVEMINEFIADESKIDFLEII